MKIAVLAGWANSLVNFRGSLISEFVRSGHEVIAFAPEAPAEIEARLAELGASYEQVTLRRTGMNPMHDAIAFKSLRSLLKRHKPDILLSYTMKPVIYGSLAAADAGVGRIYSIITGLGYAFQGVTARQRISGAAIRPLLRRSLVRNHRVFFQNPDDMRLFHDLGLAGSAQSVLINGSGVDTAHYALAEPAVQPVSFLLIARLLREKGIREYAEAARILKESYPDAAFRLLGPFDDNPSSIGQATVDSWHDSGILDYLGETGDVRPHLAASSVYVLPSYREGTPRSVLEAMSMGRPVVTTDVPGCRETVNDGENGYLVKPRDPISLATAMGRFIEEPDLIPAMGARSRALADEKYDVHKVNRVILETMGLDGARD